MTADNGGEDSGGMTPERFNLDTSSGRLDWLTFYGNVLLLALLIGLLVGGVAFHLFGQ